MQGGRLFFGPAMRRVRIISRSQRCSPRLPRRPRKSESRGKAERMHGVYGVSKSGHHQNWAVPDTLQNMFLLDANLDSLDSRPLHKLKLRKHPDMVRNVSEALSLARKPRATFRNDARLSHRTTGPTRMNSHKPALTRAESFSLLLNFVFWSMAIPAK